MAKSKRKSRKELELENSQLKDQLIKALSKIQNVNLPWNPQGIFDHIGVRLC